METLKEIIQKLEGDPYQILNTDPKAQFAQLRKNYRTLALKYHPDRNKEEEATQQFIRINRAYEFLQVQSNRKLYADHIRAIEEQKKRIQNMDSERKRLIQNLKRREQQKEKHKEQMAAEVKRRKQYYENKMREEDEREALRQQITKQMNPQQYYEEMSTVIVKWEKGLSFTSKMLQIAFKDYGQIVKATIQASRKRGLIVLNSIQKAATLVNTFKHPLIKVQLQISGEKRTRWLGALQKRKTDIDLSLSSQNIARLKDLINRKSNLYFESSRFMD